MPESVRVRIAAGAGFLIVAAFSLNHAPGLDGLARLLLDQPWFPPPLRSDVFKCALAAALAFVGFAGAGRRPVFYGMRAIAKPDAIAMLKTLAALFSAVIVLRSVQAYLFPAGSGGAGPVDAEDLPLAYGLAGAVVAGLTEEFAYRGYLIEELDALTGRRALAAGLSVVVFGLAHVGSGYGWSVELIYPTIYGLAMTVLYLWKRNLWVCVLMHTGLDALYAWFHAV
jgi:membrane protease YdiL (CAAX protease family)